jgi:hypothetical protein
MIATTVFASSAILAFLLQPQFTQFQKQNMVYFIVSGLLLMFIGIRWLFGYPIDQIIIVFSDYIVEDTTSVPSNHPVIIQFILVSSGVVLGTSLLSSIALTVMAVYYEHEEIETALAFSIVDCIILYGTNIFLLCYGFYFKTNIEKIAAKYEKENPDNHEMTTRLEMHATLIHDNNTIGSLFTQAN